MAKEKIVKCEGCGTEFTTVWSRFCSKECKGNHLKNTRQFNIPNKICEQCGTEFTPPNGRAKFCSKECGLENYKITKQPDAKKRRTLVQNKEIAAKNEEIFKGGVEDIDYVKCRICGFKSERIGNHLRLHNLTREEYLEKFPDAKTVSSVFSESHSGANNTFYQHNGNLSPFSKKFIKNYTEEQRQEVIKKAGENRDYNTRISYYTDKGYTEEEAEILRNKRQRVMSLEICIEKHGEEEGHKIYNERKNKWLKSRTRSGNSLNSKIEETFFNALVNFYQIELKRQHQISTKYSTFVIDALYNNKFIIEFNGDFWHAAPSKYQAEDVLKHPGSYKVAKDIWKRDSDRNNALEKLGYKVIIVWEGEYRIDPEAVIKQVGEDLGLIELVE